LFALKRVFLAAATVGVAAVGVVAVAQGTSGASHATIVARDSGITISLNKYVQDNMSFAPGTATVASGGTITLKFDKPGSQEPHTLTIVRKDQLPKTAAQVENCKACQRYATPHLKNPKAEPGQGNPIVHWILNKGAPGLDTPGDSVAIQEPGRHKSVTVNVSAHSGTTLYFVCAVHPWMQGKILVR
jgi:plastocyanin